MKIVTFNTFGPPLCANLQCRFVKLAQELTLIDPDIINLQEVFLKEEFNILEKGLPGYFFTHKYRWGRGGTLIITKKDVGKSSFVPFRNQGGIISIADRLAPKGYRYVKDLTNGTIIINVHFLCLYRELRSEKRTIESQLSELADFINLIPSSNKIILTGDFNLPPQRPEVLSFVQRTGLYDPSLADQKTHCSQNPDWKIGLFNRINCSSVFNPNINEKYKKLDYVLLRGFDKGKVTQQVIFDKPFKSDSGKEIYLSDHFGLLVANPVAL